MDLALGRAEGIGVEPLMALALGHRIGMRIDHKTGRAGTLNDLDEVLARRAEDLLHDFYAAGLSEFRSQAGDKAAWLIHRTLLAGEAADTHQVA